MSLNSVTEGSLIYCQTTDLLVTGLDESLRIISGQDIKSIIVLKNIVEQKKFLCLILHKDNFEYFYVNHWEIKEEV